MTVGLAAGYYVAGSTVVAWLTARGQLDSRVGLIVLPLMCLAHACCKAVAGKHRGSGSGSRSLTQKCMACHNDIGLVRRLTHHRFCSEQHEQMYLVELQKLAVARLRSARLAMVPPETAVELPLNNAEGGELCGTHSIASSPVGIKCHRPI
jgi:hypothetical protein